MLDLQQDVWLTPNTAEQELATDVAVAGDTGRRSSRISESFKLCVCMCMCRGRGHRAQEQPLK
eukprot:917290-Pelagomonas_calceolata.AAC.4